MSCDLMAGGGSAWTSFGFLDLIAVEPGKTGVLGVQCCITGDQARRLEKIHSVKVWTKAKLWLEAGNRITVMAWAKRGEKQRWTLSETEVTDT